MTRHKSTRLLVSACFSVGPGGRPLGAYATGDFDVSDPKWNQINWDADGDGAEEELLFEYLDNGDEAPRVITITLYRNGGVLETEIDRAYGLSRVLAGENAQGPYLQIDYAMGDYYAHDAEGRCILRLLDGELILTGEDP